VKKLKENIRCTLLVRRKAVENYGYKMTTKDRIYYFITWVFKFIPPKITYTVFNIIRNN
jgi:hypothetical protein